MSSKRKSAGPKKGVKPKSRKVEYDDEDISSEHESDLDDTNADAGSNVDGDDATEEDQTDVSEIPELHPPEVFKLIL